MIKITYVKSFMGMHTMATILDVGAGVNLAQTAYIPPESGNSIYIKTISKKSNINNVVASKQRSLQATRTSRRSMYKKLARHQAASCRPHASWHYLHAPLHPRYYSSE